MTNSVLEGKLILVVEDEVLVSLDIEQQLRAAGADVAVATSLEAAWPLVHAPALSAAVLDWVVADGNSEPICLQLRRRRVPFVVHSGLPPADLDAPYIGKPTDGEAVVKALTSLLQAR